MSKHRVYRVDVYTEKILPHRAEFEAWLAANGVEINITVSVEYVPSLNKITAHQYIRDENGKFFVCYGCEDVHKDSHAAVMVKGYPVEFKPEQLILDDLDELMDRIGDGYERSVGEEDGSDQRSEGTAEESVLQADTGTEA